MTEHIRFHQFVTDREVLKLIFQIAGDNEEALKICFVLWEDCDHYTQVLEDLLRLGYDAESLIALFEHWHKTYSGIREGVRSGQAQVFLEVRKHLVNV